MSVANLEGNGSLDALIRHALGGGSNTPYLMTNGGPVQWIQLVNGFDGPGLNNPQVLGWPLTTRPKMQKCEKCSREFWSPINYRRHVRGHRRSLNENDKNRDLLAAFWDSLSLEQTKELTSFSGVMLKDIPGQRIIATLTSSLHPPALWSIPSVCVDVGAALLDIIQATPSRLPINSHDLFSILDGASEGTFLCAGTPESVEKYVFDGNTAVNSLEVHNLVASTGFLFEQQLVKAWFAEKDAEALRCQKLLVEEEEAAQRRQAAILEKKRQKKLRKEQKMKEIYVDDKQALDVVDSVDSETSAEAFGISSPPGGGSSSPDAPKNNDSTLESLQFESGVDIESQLDLSSQHILENSETMGTQVMSRNGPAQLTSNNWQVRRSQARPRFNVGQNRQTFKPTPRNQIQQNRSRSRVWTKKYKDDSDKNGSKPPAFKEETKPQIEDKCDDVKPPAFKEETTPLMEEDKCNDVHPPAFKEETTPQMEEDKCDGVNTPAFKEETTPQIEEDKCDDVKPPAFKEETTPQIEEESCSDVIIGSIPVTLKSRREEVIIGSIPITLKSKRKEVIIGSIAVTLKNSVSTLAEKNARRTLTKNTVGSVNGHDGAISGENSQSTNSDTDNQGELPVSLNANALEGGLPFCSASAEEFLARRWKEANSAEHVKLDISSQTELPPGRCVENHKTASQVSDIPKRSVLGNVENNQVGVGVQAKKYRKKANKALKQKE